MGGLEKSTFKKSIVQGFRTVIYIYITDNPAKHSERGKNLLNGLEDTARNRKKVIDPLVSDNPGHKGMKWKKSSLECSDGKFISNGSHCSPRSWPIVDSFY
jgi:hypothetical protein